MRHPFIIAIGIALFAVPVRAQYEADISAISVVNPSEGQTISLGTSFQPVGSFAAQGAEDFLDVPVRVQIRSCKDGQIIYRADTTIPEIYPDAPAINLSFPSKQGAYDIRNLPPGCYGIAVITNKPDDGDRSNDTAYSNFTVIIRDDISVDSAISPLNNSDFAFNASIPITFSFRNEGTNSETNVRVSAQITDRKGNVIYRDSSTINNWSAKEPIDIAFHKFIPPDAGIYTVTAASFLPSDQFSGNSTFTSTFKVGRDCDAAAVSVIVPAPDQLLIRGIGFRPTALFRWEGYVPYSPEVPVSVQIRRCTDNSLVFLADTVIPFLSLDSGNLKFILPSQGPEGSIADLVLGCYNLCIITKLSCDGNPDNDTACTVFNIVLTNDISVDTITSPRNGFRMLIDSSVPIRCRLTNRGTHDQVNVGLTAIITAPDGSIVFRDTIFLRKFASNQRIDTSFGNFSPHQYGQYLCSVISLLETDQKTSNDTCRSYFRSTGKSDVAAISITNPSPNAIIPLGQTFKPTGLFQAFFGLKDFFSIPVECRVLRCSDDQVMFLSHSVIPKLALDSAAISFSLPSQQGTYDLRNLPAGCYRLELIASYSSDVDRSDDTASIPFSVFSHAGVEGQISNATGQLMLDQNFPNPFSTSTTIGYSLPENGSVTFKIYDMTGRIMQTVLENNNAEAGVHQLSLNLQDLPSGIYIYELRLTNAKGNVTKISKRMTVMK